MTITIKRSDLVNTMMGAIPFDEQINSGKAKSKGNREVYKQLKSILLHFDLGFEVMPGTGKKDLTPEQNMFEQEALGDIYGA